MLCFCVSADVPKLLREEWDGKETVLSAEDMHGKELCDAECSIAQRALSCRSKSPHAPQSKSRSADRARLQPPAHCLDTSAPPALQGGGTA